MRIGIVTQWSDCGAGHVSRAYQATLTPHHQVFIYARGSSFSSAAPMWHEDNVHWPRPHACVSGFNIRDFQRWVKRNSINVVIFNEQRWWSGVIAAQNLGVLTGAYVDYYTAPTVPFFGLYDFLICNTKRHFSVFEDHKQAIYCPWGTDVGLFKPPASVQIANSDVCFFTNAGFGGANATADPSLDRRGTEYVLLAMPKVRGDCRLVIHSQCALAACPTSWQKLVAQDPRITFIHKTVAPPGLYHMGKVYVYPSRLDGIGLTLPEALSSGLGAITTAAAPMNEFVQDGVNGRLVRVAKTIARHDGYYWPETLVDIDDLANAMQSYVDNPDVVIAHGRQARRLAERELDWKKNSQFLSAWVSGCAKTVNLSEPEYADLAAKAMRYDFFHHPTPWQQCLLGVRRYLRLFLPR